MPNFKVVSFNPNESTGGAGCLCSEFETHDTQGPFVVFYGDAEMDSPMSPVPVLCVGCARLAVRDLDGDRSIKDYDPVTGKELPKKELPEL